MAQTAKNLLPMQATGVQSLGWEDPLEKEMGHTPRLPTAELIWPLKIAEEFETCSPPAPQARIKMSIRTHTHQHA